MYRGATILNLDGKNRFAVPTKYREHLLIESNGAMVFTAHPHGCLLLYPKEAWTPIQSKIMQLSSFNKKSSGLQRLLVGYGILHHGKCGPIALCNSIVQRAFATFGQIGEAVFGMLFHGRASSCEEVPGVNA